MNPRIFAAVVLGYASGLVISADARTCGDVPHPWRNFNLSTVKKNGLEEGADADLWRHDAALRIPLTPGAPIEIGSPGSPVEENILLVKVAP